MNIKSLAKPVALACSIFVGTYCLTSCKQKTTETKKLSVNIETRLKNDINEANNKYKEDSIDFCKHAADSTSAKKQLEALKNKYIDIISKHPAVFEHESSQCYFEALNETHNNEEHVVAELAQNLIEEAQLKVDIATGKIFKDSKSKLKDAQNAYRAHLSANKYKNELNKIRKELNKY